MLTALNLLSLRVRYVGTELFLVWVALDIISS